MRAFLLSAIGVTCLAGCGTGTPANQSSEAFENRLNAAKLITEMSKRDDALAKLAGDCSEAGDVEYAKKAVQLITEMGARDNAYRVCALKLAAGGKREDAVGFARSITQMQLRDQTLADIAKDNTGQ